VINLNKLKSETKLSKSNVALEIMVKDWGGNNELKHENWNMGSDIINQSNSRSCCYVC